MRLQNVTIFTCRNEFTQLEFSNNGNENLIFRFFRSLQKLSLMNTLWQSTPDHYPKNVFRRVPCPVPSSVIVTFVARIPRRIYRRPRRRSSNRPSKSLLRQQISRAMGLSWKTMTSLSDRNHRRQPRCLHRMWHHLGWRSAFRPWIISWTTATPFTSPKSSRKWTRRTISGTVNWVITKTMTRTNSRMIPWRIRRCRRQPLRLSSLHRPHCQLQLPQANVTASRGRWISMIYVRMEMQME